jgi:hypothetical protein
MEKIKLETPKIGEESIDKNNLFKVYIDPFKHLCII